jgi:hypothetical protein
MRRLALVTLALAALVASLLAPAARATQEEKPEPTPRPAASAHDRQQLRSERALAQLNERAAARDALGTYFDAATGEHVVAIPRSGRGSQLRRADVEVPGVRVRVERRDIARETLDKVAARVEQRAWHPQAQRYAYGHHVDPENGVAVIETDAPADVVAPLLEEFGDDVEYRTGTTGRLNRFNDPPPHWGGATVRSGTATCTSAFNVRNSAGTRFMLTAGHCFPQGATVRSGSNTYVMGTVVNRAPFPTWDMELIGGGSYGTFMYRGNDYGSATKVVGAADPATGFTGYCFNGQTTASSTGGESCGLTVTSLNGTFCDAAGCTPSLITFTGRAPRPGDSGAPFYLPASNGVHARGMVIAVSGSTGYAERWNAIAARFGVTYVP